MDQTKLILFPEALKDARKKAKLSQTELAKRAGISLISIRRYESGESFPDIATLGSISVALPDEPLVAAWSNSWLANNTTEEGVAPAWRDRMNVYHHARENAVRKYWKKLIEEGKWQFLRFLVSTAQYYQQMNTEGIKKAIEVVELISKVPEYQADAPWAFRDENKKGDIDAEGETESE